jgi:epsilon-lactone hydrolase
MASWQSFAVCMMLRFTMKRAGRNGIDVAKVRSSIGKPRSRVLKIPPGWRVGPLTADGLTFEITDKATLSGLRDDLAVLYFHGGGYFFGSPQTHRQLALDMARHCDAPVFSLAYRLAPEHRFPAALDDAVAAYRWLANAFPQRRIILAGDSAGGGLALDTALEARDRGLAMPAAIITFSPWTDLTLTGPSVDSNNRSCAMFTAKGVREAAKYYLGNADPRDPRASPLYADLRGLPPHLIFASTDEVLRDDSTRFAAKAHEQGVAVELHLVPGVPHVWPIFARILPEGRESLRQVQAFVARTVPCLQSRAA